NPRRPTLDRDAALIGSAAHAEANLELTRRSLVLLRNTGALPLAGGFTARDDAGRATGAGADRPRRVAVVGPLADAAQAQLGDWAGSSGQADWPPDGHPRHMISTVLDGLRDLTPQDWTLTSALGAEIVTLVTPPEGDTLPDGQPRPKIAVPREPDAE